MVANFPLRLAGVFDELGWPWLEHDCGFSRSDRRWAQSRPRTRLACGGVRVEISDGVTATRPAEDRGWPWNIDQAVMEAAERSARSRERSPIERVVPGYDPCPRIGDTQLHGLDSSVVAAGGRRGDWGDGFGRPSPAGCRREGAGVGLSVLPCRVRAPGSVSAICRRVKGCSDHCLRIHWR